MLARIFWVVLVLLLLSTGAGIYLGIIDLESNDVAQSEVATSSVSSSTKKAPTLAVAEKLIPEPDVLLPDIFTEKPANLFVQIEPQSGERELRFDTSFLNIGSGSLEIKGVSDPETSTTHVIQHIFQSDGTFGERSMGDFVFHHDHNHWHVTDFVKFALYSYKSDGSLDKLMTQTGKMSFCLYDATRGDALLTGMPNEATYKGCNNEVQGLSVGWRDTYAAKIVGQRIGLTYVPNGRYAFVSTVDPDQKILEKGKANNVSVMYIELEGLNVTVLDRP